MTGGECMVEILRAISAADPPDPLLVNARFLGHVLCLREKKNASIFTQTNTFRNTGPRTPGWGRWTARFLAWQGPLMDFLFG